MNTPCPLNNLSDAELVGLCLQHQRSAWEEFFRRFSPLFKKNIRRTFIKCGVSYLAEDFDNVMDIHAALVEKLYAKGALNQCHDLSGLRAWLNRIAINQTIGWLREKGRIKNLPRDQEERLIKSLSAPLNEEDDFTLGDLIVDEDADLFFQLEQAASRLYAECVIEQIGAINNVTHRWILRLQILGQISLSDSELEQLASMTPLSRNELVERIDTLESSLEQKEKDRQDELGKAVLCWHQLRNLENRIARLDKDTFIDHSQDIDILQREWVQLDRKRNEFLSSGSTLPKPSNREIAELAGIAEENCGNVSQYLRRARKTLREKIGVILESV